MHCLAVAIADTLKSHPMLLTGVLFRVSPRPICFLFSLQERMSIAYQFSNSAAFRTRVKYAFHGALHAPSIAPRRNGVHPASESPRVSSAQYYY